MGEHMEEQRERRGSIFRRIRKERKPKPVRTVPSPAPITNYAGAVTLELAGFRLWTVVTPSTGRISKVVVSCDEVEIPAGYGIVVEMWLFGDVFFSRIVPGANKDMLGGAQFVLKESAKVDVFVRLAPLRDIVPDPDIKLDVNNLQISALFQIASDRITEVPVA